MYLNSPYIFSPFFSSDMWWWYPGNNWFHTISKLSKPVSEQYWMHLGNICLWTEHHCSTNGSLSSTWWWKLFRLFGNQVSNIYLKLTLQSQHKRKLKIPIFRKSMLKNVLLLCRNGLKSIEIGRDRSFLFFSLRLATRAFDISILEIINI